ncbi:MAG: ABC transporter ATP-binding protein [Rhodospirillaceae bacterium]|nr:ABC transporter ATP-binding protein [Rhodospirillaceae bacterium]
MSSDVIVRARNLGKAFEFYPHYDDRFKQLLFGRFKTFYKQHWVLRDVNFELKRGQSLGIVGRNGVGKSTLLSLVCGITAPTTGTIETFGRIAPVLTLGAGFDGELTGRENVQIAGVVLGLKRGEVRERFDAIAEFAGLGEYMEQPVKLYSSGMFVRLAFAVCAHVDADLLIVDEALAVGDAAFHAKCLAYIDKFVATGSLLLVSHDLEQVKRLCQSALWIDRGRIREQGDPETVAGKYKEAAKTEVDDPARFRVNDAA